MGLSPALPPSRGEAGCTGTAELPRAACGERVSVTGKRSQRPRAALLTCSVRTSLNPLSLQQMESGAGQPLPCPRASAVHQTPWPGRMCILFQCTINTHDLWCWPSGLCGVSWGARPELAPPRERGCEPRDRALPGLTDCSVSRDSGLPRCWGPLGAPQGTTSGMRGQGGAGSNPNPFLVAV